MNRLSRLSVLLASAAASVLLHVTLGWAWTVVAGVGAGVGRPQQGWGWGAGGVALGWGLLLGYTLFAAPESTRLLFDLIGSFQGNIPGEAVVGLSVITGAILGGLGGGLGSLVAHSVSESNAHLQ